MLPVSITLAGFAAKVPLLVFIRGLFLHMFADLFSRHLDIELSEEDVQTVTSDCKAKTQITVSRHL